MFYSQFILAKKGPLGTIWIAAHLERKLRKNQVADTDIGVSVDSILFPEMPIALRLSSHLLLGVVRIYSRKVNYLFDDCSEALLKIKQAFRSTAVDLPPEESTAPYHSITLPETFDLDDFELPDNDIFQGNYVDHHISTRDQITLQDTMEGVVYSTSQFGLDERFGDGDTSQVGLDLEEDLFLDKVAATGHDEVSENDAQGSIEMMPHPKTDASHERMAGSSEEMPLNGTRNKIDGLAANFEVIDYAHAPSTPGLLEEPNVTSVKEVLAFDDHLESEEHNLRELVGRRSDNILSESDLDHRGDASVLSLGGNLNHDTLVSTPAEYSCLSAELDNNQAEPVEFLSTSVTTEHIPADESGGMMDGLDKVEDKSKIVSCDNEQSMPSIDRINGENEELEIRSQEIDNVGTSCNLEKSHSIDSAGVLTAVQSFEESVNIEGQDFQGLLDPESNDLKDNGQRMPDSSDFLQACNSHLSQPDESSLKNKSVVNPDLQSVDVEPLSVDTLQREEELNAFETPTKVQGEECHVSDGVQSEENRISEPSLNGEIQEDGGKQAEQLDNVISNQCEHLDSSMTSYFPAREKLLSVPQRFLDEPNDLLVQTPDMEVQEGCDGSGAGTKISGKKRTFAESSITMQSLNTLESFGVTRSKRTVDSVPDDDDLLSSILVGRSSVLKMKPTPPAPEAPPTKRARSASRPSALKRKVLLDDSMVLHGDTIRQQLINTEDIRRLRKKAPCTRTEILMIQRQFLVEEIFGEPLLTGMSVELTHVHNEAFDLSRIRVTEIDDNNHASFEYMNDENSARNNVTQGGEIEGTTDTVTCRNDADGHPYELPVQNGDQKVEDHIGSYDIDCQKHRNDIAEEMDLRSSVHDHLGEIGKMEIDKVNSKVADATNNIVLGMETLQSEPVSGDTSEMPTSSVDESAVAHDFMQMDAPNLPSDKIDTQLIEEVPFLKDMSNGIGLDGIEAVDHFAEKIVTVGTELRIEEEILLEESKISASFEIRADGLADGSAPRDDVDASLANMSSDNCMCINFDSINVDRDLEEIENDKHDVRIEDEGMAMSSGCIDDKDQTSNHLCDEESKMDSTYLVGFDGDLKNASISCEDYTICQQADYHHSMDKQNAPVNHVTAGDFDDIQDVAFANDTEFLNVDDDEIGDDDDEGMPTAEDTRLLENSGWSSRTRAVAKYLQTLFDEEAGHGRKVLSLDNLLAGKTRKEASRMFFETLVLKTRDYAHVEQAKPFDSINIKPRAKLMKSEF